MSLADQHSRQNGFLILQDASQKNLGIALRHSSLQRALMLQETRKCVLDSRLEDLEEKE